jgi:hypothetical protein
MREGDCVKTALNGTRQLFALQVSRFTPHLFWIIARKRANRLVESCGPGEASG